MLLAATDPLIVGVAVALLAALLTAAGWLLAQVIELIRQMSSLKDNDTRQDARLDSLERRHR